MVQFAYWGIVALQAAVVLVLALLFFWRRSKDLQARLEAEQRYRNLFQNVQEGIFISTPEGRFLDFNDAFLRIMGYPSREALMQVDIASACFVRPEERETYNRLLRERGAVRNFESRMRRYTGEVITLSESTVAVRNASGAVLCYQGFVRDITDRQRAQEQLLHNEKMAAMGQMMAGVAHELNNPLTAILGYSQLLADGGDVSERGRQYVQKIQKQAGRTQRIVQNLLRFSRQRNPERAPLDLDSILDDTLALREHDLKVNNITVHRQGDARLPAPFGDAHQVQQVFMNILNNAVDAVLENRNGGKIWIRSRALDHSVEVEFADSGRGVENPLRVFDPFYTTKEVGRGTGLGLSICYGIIRDHGGEIRVHNDPPCGAVFTVVLPVAPAEARSSAPAAGNEIPPEPASLGRILLVDDEEALLDLEREILLHHADQVFVAHSGREAIAILENGPVDLVVTDLKMPGEISGRDLYDWISARRPELAQRMVFTVSDVDSDDARSLASRSGCTCVQKPFHPGGFLAAVLSVAGSSHMVRAS